MFGTLAGGLPLFRLPTRFLEGACSSLWDLGLRFGPKEMIKVIWLVLVFILGICSGWFARSQSTLIVQDALPPEMQQIARLHSSSLDLINHLALTSRGASELPIESKIQFQGRAFAAKGTLVGLDARMIVLRRVKVSPEYEPVKRKALQAIESLSQAASTSMKLWQALEKDSSTDRRPFHDKVRKYYQKAFSESDQALSLLPNNAQRRAYEWILSGKVESTDIVWPPNFEGGDERRDGGLPLQR